jgi:hypothetical protein
MGNARKGQTERALYAKHLRDSKRRFWKHQRKADKVTPSSGNVFTDLGLPDADELYIKAQSVEFDEPVGGEVW